MLPRTKFIQLCLPRWLTLLATGSSNDKGHRVCADSAPIRTVTTDSNEIVSTPNGHRYLTFEELAHITAPRDKQLHKRWHNITLLDASREMANMIPATMLETIYKPAATLFSSWPRSPSASPTVSAQFTASVAIMPIASVQPSNETDQSSLHSFTNAPHVRTIPVSLRAYLFSVFPLSSPQLEHLTVANPAIVGVPAGACRLIPWPPITPRQLMHLSMPSMITLHRILQKSRVRAPRFELVS